MRQAFSGHIPTDRCYCQETDMWVIYHEGQVRIGATGFGIHLAGEVIAFTAKPDGAKIRRGKGMATIECHKTVLAVHAPVSFRLTAGNTQAEEHPALINSAPYTEGWMARGEPLDWEVERSLLCDADTYKQHVLSIDPEARFDEP
ncbi:glycine cleavage system H protein [Betaproteobacteria bacterium]|nr:glycine cleavage system H protein [Betaproteobacteria bacterium]